MLGFKPASIHISLNIEWAYMLSWVTLLKVHQFAILTLGLGSIAATSSAQESLMIDTQHLLTSSNELDKLPPNPTSFEPLHNPPPPPQKKKIHKSLPCAFISKKSGAKAAAIKLHCDRHYRAR